MVQEFQHIIRIANTDLVGNKAILYGMKKIKGVDVMIANAACSLAGVDKTKKAGNLSSAEAERLTNVLQNLVKSGVPEWMLNRRKNPETGEESHLIGPELQFAKDNDIKKLKKTKSYRGLRLQWGLPVRGQRTKSNFRKNKGKGSLGVKRKK
ncbi:30S ribosomal protein S13 [archaeon]|nr:30S ribosomal protein S13 [archaeon]MBL7057226.1 30S ribosomal protein S13 [Candidatus Woesearchaeota archaeon]